MEVLRGYGARLHQAAKREYKTFWSGYRLFVTFAVMLCPIVLQVIRHGIRSMVNIDETLANGLIGFVVSLVGTYLIAMRKGAENLDASWISEVGDKNLKIQELSLKLEATRRNPAEEHHFQLAKTAVEKHGQTGIKVLRHLRIHRRLYVGFYPPPLPEGMTLNDMIYALDALAADNMVTRTLVSNPGRHENIWEIAPAMASALDQLLYESSSSSSQT